MALMGLMAVEKSVGLLLLLFLFLVLGFLFVVWFFWWLFFRGFLTHHLPRRKIQCTAQGLVGIFILSFSLAKPQMLVVLLKHRSKRLSEYILIFISGMPI